jgi:hypothetical protein
MLVAAELPLHFLNKLGHEKKNAREFGKAIVIDRPGVIPVTAK